MNRVPGYLLIAFLYYLTVTIFNIQYPNLFACAQPDCPKVVDANGHYWPDTFMNSLVSLRCANSEAVATRTCYPPCDCSGDPPYWGTPQIQNCISAQLQLLREEFQDLISDTNLSAARFRTVVESIRFYTTSIVIKGFDPQILINLLEEIVRAFGRLNLADWEIGLFMDVIEITNTLLATDPGIWNEVGNVTENILCLHDLILKISELISEFIYSDNSLNELNFASSLIELNVVKWNHFSSNINLFNFYTPSDNLSLQIQNIHLEDLNLPSGETPLTCHAFVRRLFLPTFNSLLGIEETLDDTCVDTATQSLVYPVGLFSFGVHTSKCDTPMITLPYPTNFFRVKLSTLPFQLSEVSYQLRSVTNYSLYLETGVFPLSNCTGPFEELGDLLYYCHTIEDFILTITKPDSVPFYASPFGISFRIFMCLSSIPLIVALFVIARGFVVIIDGAVFVRINVILIILFSQLILTVGIDRTENDTVCTVLRFLLHYSAVATCVWAFIDAVNICIITFSKSYYLIFNIVYVILGYLLPLIPVGIALSISSCPYFRTSPFCWPSNKSSLNAVWHILTPFYFMLFGFTILMIVEIVVIVLERARIVVDIAEELNLLFRMLVSSFILPFLLILWWVIILYAFGEDNPSTALEVLSLVMSCIVGMYVLTVFTILVHTTSVRKEEKPTQITHFGDDGFQSNPIFRNNEIEMTSGIHTGVTFLSELDTFF